MSLDTAAAGFAENFAALGQLQKPRRGVSAYSIWVNRPAGRVLAAVSAGAGASPNHVTLLGLICSLLAIGLIVLTPASLVTAVVPGVALALGHALDSADGQLARLQGRSGPAGEWLDHMTDAGIKLTLHLAVAVAWFNCARPESQLLLPLTFQVVTVLMFLAVTLAGILRPDPGVARPRPVVRHPGLRSVLLLPVDHGALCLLFLIWGWPALFRFGYAGLLLAQLVFLVAFSITLYPELARSRPGAGPARPSSA